MEWKIKILSYFPEWREIKFGAKVYYVINRYRYSVLFALQNQIKIKIIFKGNYNASTYLSVNREFVK